MLVRVGKILLTCLLIVVLLLRGLWLFESQHSLNDYTSMIGTASDTPDMEYEISDRSSHLSYLKTFSYVGENIRYIDRGPKDGQVIVLLHGTPTNSWLRRKIIPGLIADGYRVIAPDMVGFGASSMLSNRTDLSSKKQSERLLELMDELNINKFVLGGHDQGSLRVWETITQHPERITHLIIFNSIGDRAGFHSPTGFGQENIATKMISWAMGSRLLGRIFAYGALLGGLENKSMATTTMIDGYLFPLMHGMNHTYEAFITDFDQIEADLTAYQQAFRSLAIPTLVLRGRHDKILVGEEQIPVLQELLDIKDDDIHMLDADHFVQEEVPEEIIEKIVNFVR